MNAARPVASVPDVFTRIREHEFHPLDADRFTIDRDDREHGIADPDDPDGRIRLLALRDLVRAGDSAIEALVAGLQDEDVQVRYLAATALGIVRAARARTDLEQVVREDSDPLARSAAVISLGRIAAAESLATLRACRRHDASGDVRHQAELAIDRTEKGVGATPGLRDAFAGLESESFARLEPGMRAPEFVLPTTSGDDWRLRPGQTGRWQVLIWIFAHWCPVCHREFAELIELRDGFRQADIDVATLECHDFYRSRAMVGQELEPDYWFADESFRDTYTRGIWWPHLVDRAGAVGAAWGVDPLAFSVHSEYINRPATIIIDPAGIIRYACFGAYWGDRPAIATILDMVRSGDFRSDHSRRPPPSGQ